MRISIDLTGQKFGKLTALKLNKVAKGISYWDLQCDCGNIVTRIAGNVKRPVNFPKQSCGCLPKKTAKPEAGFRRLFNDYQKSALRRNIEFNLSKEEFKELIFQNCLYCEQGPTPRYEKQVIHTLMSNGIDRVDNNQGYIKTNCITACKTCNMAKNAMPQEQFFLWIKRLHTNLLKKGFLNDT